MEGKPSRKVGNSDNVRPVSAHLAPYPIVAAIVTPRSVGCDEERGDRHLCIHTTVMRA
jgi:hypothetical protein